MLLSKNLVSHNCLHIYELRKKHSVPCRMVGHFQQNDIPQSGDVNLARQTLVVIVAVVLASSHGRVVDSGYG
jgi:hypothetical protein